MTSDVCCVGREPTEDERQGMRWWNGLSESARLYWLDRAQVKHRPGQTPWGVSAADAWAVYKREMSRDREVSS